MSGNDALVILMADDDLEDRMLISEALEEAGITRELHFVNDGEELMDYLCRRGDYTGMIESPLPGLILLDLNMPRRDGREALLAIKKHPIFKRLPIVVLSTSQASSDVNRSYALGANAFISKPVTFKALVQMVKSVHDYWFNIVSLPESYFNGTC